MQEHPTPDQYGFERLKAEHARNSVRWYMLPIMILLRPGRFMLSWGIHANIAWILLAAWIVGAGRMTNWVVNQQRMHADPLPLKIEAWPILFGVLIALGLIRGVFEYTLGGAWTCLRLRICGVRGNEWNRSTRIYLFTRMIEKIPSLLLLVYFSIRYSSVSEYIDQPVGISNYLAGIFIFVSPIIAYIAVLSCYRLHKVWATILFLVWPLFWRAALISSAMIYASMTNRYMGAYPDTQHPKQASEGVLEFDHPNGWLASIADPNGPRPVEATITSANQEASLVIRVQPREEVDLIKFDLNELAELGYRINTESPAPNVRIANQAGDGVDYMISRDGKQLKMFHLLVHFDVDHDVLFRFIATERYWWHAMEGWKQTLSSLSIGDLYQIVPDIQSPMSIERDVFSLDAPGNWNLNESNQGPFTTLELSAKQYSWFTATIYDRDMTAQEELDMYLNHSIDDELVSHTEMTTWMGLRGVGAQGQLRDSLAGFRQFRTLFVPLADARVLVVKVSQAESSAELTDPGFELIESTFKLLAEPAEVDP